MKTIKILNVNSIICWLALNYNLIPAATSEISVVFLCFLKDWLKRKKNVLIVYLFTY